MSSRRAHAAAADPVGRWLARVWLVGHLATAFTLGTLLTQQQADITAEKPTATRPDLDASPQARDV